MSFLAWLGILLGLVGNVWMALADIVVAGWIAGGAVRAAVTSNVRSEAPPPGGPGGGLAGLVPRAAGPPPILKESE